MKLYHVSEEPGIEVFETRHSPQHYNSINENVVFAISDVMLHNYLLPRDCPRVNFYAKADSTQIDNNTFMRNSKKKYIVNIEESWLERVKQTALYLYELPIETFTLLDEGAGYYISYIAVKPLSVLVVDDLLSEIVKRDVELRVLSSLKQLEYEVSNSSLQFSIIRMRNAV
ncbi:MAG: DUF6886 family protein [Ignavibacteria bacterium]